MSGPRSPGHGSGPKLAAGEVLATLAGLRHPVVLILLLIAFFAAISGKPLDGVLMLAAALCLAWDAGRRLRARRAAAAIPAAAPAPGPAPAGGPASEADPAHATGPAPEADPAHATGPASGADPAHATGPAPEAAGAQLPGLPEACAAAIPGAQESEAAPFAGRAPFGGAAPVAAPPPAAGGVPAAAQLNPGGSRQETAVPGRARRRRLLVAGTGVAAAVGYAALIGSLIRYSWPVTIAIVGLGLAIVAIGWRGPVVERPPDASPVPWPGLAVWGGLLVAGGLWELSALLQQPTMTTDSYAHPTISSLTDPLLAVSDGRAVILLAWLAVGWYLVRR